MHLRRLFQALWTMAFICHKFASLEALYMVQNTMNSPKGVHLRLVTTTSWKITAYLAHVNNSMKMGYFPMEVNKQNLPQWV